MFLCPFYLHFLFEEAEAECKGTFPRSHSQKVAQPPIMLHFPIRLICEVWNVSREKEFLTILQSLVEGSTLLPTYFWIPLKLRVYILVSKKEKKSSLAVLGDSSIYLFYLVLTQFSICALYFTFSSKSIL